MNLVVPVSNIERLYSTLDSIGNLTPLPGFTRVAWSDKESSAIDFIQRQAEALGMVPSYPGQPGFSGPFDGVGNLFMQLPGSSDKRLQIGSHIDTVPQGGNYDGAAGIVAGLEAIRAISKSGRETTHGLEIVIWRGEESAAYAPALKGSAAAFGTANPAMLENRYEDVSLVEAIRTQGFDPSYITKGLPTLSEAIVENVAGHLELHIEQARVLEEADLPVGVVTGIFGNDRYLFNLAESVDDRVLARTLVRLDETFAEHGFADRGDGVQTFGVVNPQPGNDRLSQCAVTKVSGYSRVFIDRSYEEVADLAREIERDFGVEIRNEGETTRSQGASTIQEVHL